VECLLVLPVEPVERVVPVPGMDPEVQMVWVEEEVEVEIQGMVATVGLVASL
jgi:hypothetical protein